MERPRLVLVVGENRKAKDVINLLNNSALNIQASGFPDEESPCDAMSFNAVCQNFSSTCHPGEPGIIISVDSIPQEFHGCSNVVLCTPVSLRPLDILTKICRLPLRLPMFFRTIRGEIFCLRRFNKNDAKSLHTLMSEPACLAAAAGPSTVNRWEKFCVWAAGDPADLSIALVIPPPSAFARISSPPASGRPRDIEPTYLPDVATEAAGWPVVGKNLFRLD